MFSRKRYHINPLARQAGSGKANANSRARAIPAAIRDEVGKNFLKHLPEWEGKAMESLSGRIRGVGSGKRGFLAAEGTAIAGNRTASVHFSMAGSYFF